MLGRHIVRARQLDLLVGGVAPLRPNGALLLAHSAVLVLLDGLHFPLVFLLTSIHKTCSLRAPLLDAGTSLRVLQLVQVRLVNDDVGIRHQGTLPHISRVLEGVEYQLLGLLQGRHCQLLPNPRRFFHSLIALLLVVHIFKFQ